MIDGAISDDLIADACGGMSDDDGAWGPAPGDDDACGGPLGPAGPEEVGEGGPPHAAASSVAECASRRPLPCAGTPARQSAGGASHCSQQASQLDYAEYLAAGDAVAQQRQVRLSFTCTRLCRNGSPAARRGSACCGGQRARVLRTSQVP